MTVAKRATDESATFGGGQMKYEIIGTFWASKKFNKGMKSLMEGALDAYNTVMFRMDYHANIDRWCILQSQGKWYQIESFNDSFQENEIQITAKEIANPKSIVIVQPYYPGASQIAGGDAKSHVVGK